MVGSRLRKIGITVGVLGIIILISVSREVPMGLPLIVIQILIGLAITSVCIMSYSDGRLDQIEQLKHWRKEAEAKRR